MELKKLSSLAATLILALCTAPLANCAETEFVGLDLEVREAFSQARLGGAYIPLLAADKCVYAGMLQMGGGSGQSVLVRGHPGRVILGGVDSWSLRIKSRVCAGVHSDVDLVAPLRSLVPSDEYAAGEHVTAIERSDFEARKR